MDNWAVLGISPTQDPEEVKLAYMTLLPSHNPEVNPEGFLRLRTAYEEVISSLETKKETTDSPHALFMKEVEKIYQDFNLRCDVNIWRSLLETEVCQRLDLVDEAEGMLLEFLLQKFYLPMDVFALLASHFDWQSRADELKQEYPPRFIDYIIEKMTEVEYPKYNLFIPLCDNPQYDLWISLFLELDVMIKSGQTKNPMYIKKQAQLETMPIKHPYFDILRVRLHICNEEYDQAMDIIEPLLTKYPEDLQIKFVYATVLPNVGKADEALTRFAKIAEENPNFIDATRGILSTQIYIKDYKSAEATIKQLLDINPYDIYAMSSEQQVAHELVKIYEAENILNPSDSEIVLALAVNLAKTQQVDQCLNMLSQVSHDDPKCREIKALCAVIRGDWETALSLYKDLINTNPKLSYYGNAATALCNLGQHAEALAYTKKAQNDYTDDATNHDKTKLYAIQCQALTALRNYHDAQLAVDTGLSITPKDAYLIAQKANLFLQIGRYSEGIDLSEMALWVFPYMTDPYIVQMEIYFKESMHEMVCTIADQAEHVGYNSPKISCYKARSLRVLGRYDQALEIMEALVEADYHEGYLEAIYTEMAQLKEETGNLSDAALYIDKALLLDKKDNPPRQIIKANILRKLGLYDKAKAICEKIIHTAPKYVRARVCLGNILIDEGNLEDGLGQFEIVVLTDKNLEHFYDLIVDLLMNSIYKNEALEWTKRRLDRFESLHNRIYVAIMLVRLNELEEAEEMYKKAIEIYPNAPDGSRFYGLFLQSNRRYHEAIVQFENSLKLAENQLDLYEAIAFCYQEEKEYEKALQALDIAEKTEDPYNKGALLMRRGVIYEDMLRHDESLGEMLKAASMPDKLDGEWLMSWIYTRIGLKYSKNYNNATKAMEYLEMAISEDENCIDAIDCMGDIYMYAYKDYEKAIDCYTKKIDKEPTDPHAYVTRGLAYAKTKQHEKANKDFNHAILLFQEKSKDDPSPCWEVYIANCRLGLGEIEVARDLFKNNLDTPKKNNAWCNKPKCDVCIYSLGLIAEMEKDYEAALEYYEQAIKISNSIKHNVARDDLLTKTTQLHI